MNQILKKIMALSFLLLAIVSIAGCDFNFGSVTKTEYSVTAVATAGGQVYGSGNYDKDDTATVIAIANEGYTFVNWTKNNVEISTSASYTFTVIENVVLLANFTQDEITPSTYSLNINSTNGGNTTGVGVYNANSTVTVVATANEGYEFYAWFLNNQAVSYNSNYTFVITQNTTLEAKFVQVFTYIATVNIQTNNQNYYFGGEANIEQSTYFDLENFKKATSVTLTATANSGFSFVGWSLNGSIISTNATFTKNLTSNVTITAKFEANEQIDITGKYVAEIEENIYIYEFKTDGTVDGIIYLYDLEEDVYTTLTFEGTFLTIGNYIIDTKNSDNSITPFTLNNDVLTITNGENEPIVFAPYIETDITGKYITEYEDNIYVYEIKADGMTFATIYYYDTENELYTVETNEDSYFTFNNYLVDPYEENGFGIAKYTLIDGVLTIMYGEFEPVILIPYIETDITGKYVAEINDVIYVYEFKENGTVVAQFYFYDSENDNYTLEEYEYNYIVKGNYILEPTSEDTYSIGTFTLIDGVFTIMHGEYEPMVFTPYIETDITGKYVIETEDNIYVYDFNANGIMYGTVYYYDSENDNYTNFTFEQTYFTFNNYFVNPYEDHYVIKNFTITNSVLKIENYDNQLISLLPYIETDITGKYIAEINDVIYVYEFKEDGTVSGVYYFYDSENENYTMDTYEGTYLSFNNYILDVMDEYFNITTFTFVDGILTIENGTDEPMVFETIIEVDITGTYVSELQGSNIFVFNFSSDGIIYRTTYYYDELDNSYSIEYETQIDYSVVANYMVIYELSTEVYYLNMFTLENGILTLMDGEGQTATLTYTEDLSFLGD